MRYRYQIWWACRNRPFFVAQQLVEFVAESVVDAELMVMTSRPSGPFMHVWGNESCCYITQYEAKE